MTGKAKRITGSNSHPNGVERQDNVKADVVPQGG